MLSVPRPPSSKFGSSTQSAGAEGSQPLEMSAFLGESPPEPSGDPFSELLARWRRGSANSWAANFSNCSDETDLGRVGLFGFQQTRQLSSRDTGTATFLSRPDVLELLQQICEDRPEDLMHWMQAYSRDLMVETAAPPHHHSSSMISVSQLLLSAHPSLTTADVHRDDLYDMLDWRFFTLNKEREVAVAAKSHMEELMLKRSHWDRQAPLSLHAYLPHVIRKAIRDEKISFEDARRVEMSGGDKTTPYNPSIVTFDSAVVLVDASGFTALTEKLATQPHGAEEIGGCLNGFFEPLIKIVVDHGGDILKFSGDALTILWPATTDMEVDDWEEPVAITPTAAAVAACRCCLEMHGKVERQKAQAAGIKLTLHIGVAYGRVNILQFGGLRDRWEFIGAGAPFEEMAVAEMVAQQGETVVSPSFQKVVQADSWAKRLFNFQELIDPIESAKGYAYLTPARSEARKSMEMLSNYTQMKQASFMRDNSFTLSSRISERFIPQAIVTRLTGKGDIEAEMRRVSVIFLCIRGLDPGTSHDDASRTQLVMRLMQRSIYAYEGSINKFLVDDKGMLLLSVFGIPPLNHYSDDPLRAVLAARRLCDTLHEELVEGQAGIATGVCWCGAMGSELRREYTVLGDTVNLAARLMAKTDPNTVLVDHTTYTDCKSTLEFKILSPIKVKGKAHEVRIYLFTGRLVSRAVQTQRVLESPLFSWEKWPVKTHLISVLEETLKRGKKPGGIVFVKGGPGCGKTEAAQHLKAWAKSKGLSLLAGQNMNPTSTFTVARLCWQEVFSQLLNDAIADPHWRKKVQEAKRSSIIGKLTTNCEPFLTTADLYRLIKVMIMEVGGDDELLTWAPLLSFVMPSINFGAKGVSALLERDEQRRAGTPRLAELCAKVLQAYTAQSSNIAGTVVLIHMKRGTSYFHDQYIHDMNIARAVGDLTAKGPFNGRPIIFCVVSRQPILRDNALHRIAEYSGNLVNARNLSKAETESFLVHLLGGISIPPFLIDHVYEACGGTPYSIEVLYRQFLELGIVKKGEGGKHRLSPEWSEAKTWPHPGPPEFPETLRGMSLATFEKLQISEQEVLKTAAVHSLQTEQEDEGSRTDFCAKDLQRSLERSSLDVVERLCERLVRLEIFCYNGEDEQEFVDSSESGTDEEVPVSPRIVKMQMYAFTSRMLRDVASKLVLESRRQDIRAKRRTYLDGSMSLRVRGLRSVDRE